MRIPSNTWLFSAVLNFGILFPGCDHSQKPPERTSKPTIHKAPYALHPTQALPELTPLCEYEGRIRHVVFHSAEGLVGQAWRSVHDLLIAMPQETRVTFVCNSPAALQETRGRLRQWNLKRDNIRPILIETPISVWSRDRYIAMRPPADDGLAVWLVPQVVSSIDKPRRENERRVPELLNPLTSVCRVAETPLVFEGGNLIASGKYIFMGANVVADNTDLPATEDAHAALNDLFATPVILIRDRTGAPPVAHVDMFLTPVADDHVIVGSPALAAKIVKVADAASIEALHHKLFITPELPGGLEASFSKDRIARFDEVATDLEQRGLRVTRIPYADSRGGDFIVTYNNVVQETRAGRRIVYMPIYQIPALDEAARRAYESLGFAVKPIDVSPICHLLGAVRCLANVVERDRD